MAKRSVLPARKPKPKAASKAVADKIDFPIDVMPSNMPLKRGRAMPKMGKAAAKGKGKC